MTDKTDHTPADVALSVPCPSWCTLPHSTEALEEAHHQGPAIAFTGPGDHTGYFDGGEPYEVLWACINADPDRRDGVRQRPFIYFDTQGMATGGHLDVEQADAVLRDLRAYVDRLQQMRDRLAQIIENQGEQA